MYPPHHQGGYELVWRAAVVDLRAHGHEVTVLTTDHREPGVPDGDEPDVHRTLRWYWHDHDWPALGLRERARLERHNAAALTAVLERARPDVVAWWSMGGMSLSLLDAVRRRGLPAVAFVHDDWILYAPRRDLWLATPGPLRRLAGVPLARDLGPAAEWVFVSEHTRDRALHHGAWTLARTAIAHSGIDPRFLDPAPERPWEGRLLVVGRLDERKGADVAVTALAALPDATLTVAGDGDADYARRLRETAAAAGVADRVRLLGPVARRDLPALYAAHDATVFPVRWEEPWGLVPLESMGVGRPVVATARGGAAEYLRDGVNALVVPPDDPDAVAEAVGRLAADPALRGRLRTAGAATAAAHTHERFHEQVRAAISRAGRG
ncbi:glycosyltransferase family 4 protein [Paraconexibacter algicola]|uniref:Glycosyltransferase n=1 Tax=Paraconexibacter algicola TaxID=2133960 RepID=A0A2T4UCC5_9ACTN|nr:glycosyltransferase family 4 protein [Paraconexibacter algicola]PTL54859.1 hypothetical protein C7Y72_19955 [Paraconexibacter algicola]